MRFFRFFLRGFLLLCAMIIALVVSALLFLSVGRTDEAKEIQWGVTFGHSQAESLGVDGTEALTALLDDLGVRRFRIPIYWDELEAERGRYDFRRFDRELEAIESRKGNVILVVGRKQPRWPECREPQWFPLLDRNAQDRALFEMLTAVVTHYRSHGSVLAWQVENEPFLHFGICPKDISRLLDEEIALVRRLDPSRPIIITDTGEFSTWLQAGRRADILGSTLYRIIHDPTFGYVRYPIRPIWYHRKVVWLRWWNPNVRVIFTEVQAEPWVVKPPISQYPIEVQEATMNPEKLRSVIAYVRQTGFDEAYLWGSEWWYWLKRKGRPEAWETLRPIFRENRDASPH